MTSDEATTVIQKLLDEGRQAYDKQDYETSTSKFGDACQQLDTLNGELDLKNGDAYFLYGRALLQYAIQQNSVLGQSAQASAEVVENQTESKPSDENSNPRFQFDEKPTFVTDQPSETGQGNNESADEEDDEEDQEPQEDDFETAWYVLDATRVIFEKGDDDASKLKLADVLLCLGDVSLETEKFNEALPDLKKALEIKESISPADDRQLAEAHYKYALALELSTDSQSLALPELENAQNVLLNRIKSLETGDGNNNDDKGKSKYTPSADNEKEIKEIKELVSDLKEKIEELSTRQDNEREAEKLLQKLIGNATSNQPVNVTPANVHDLTTFIKRKVKDTEDKNNQSDTKKAKTE